MTSSRPFLLVLLTVLMASLTLVAPPATPAVAASDPAFVADTQEHFRRLETLGFAGVVLVVERGVPLFARGYGLADREHAVPWSPGTVSTVGSITKQLTAAAILALAEDGALRVDDPITTYFGGVPADKRGITLHQLLTHSSGIVDLAGVGDWDPIGRDEFVERILAQPLAFAPGGDYAYSNAGYSLLGAIIERLSGESYERFVRRRFFLPLGLYETGYLLPAWGEGRLAQGYDGDEPWGTVLGRPMAEDGPHWVLRANGGIHATAYDMLRWAEALLAGRVLPAAAMERLWTPHVREGEDADTHYGYGWVVMDLGEGMRVVTHNGGNGIFFADLALVPSQGIVIYLATNVAAGNPYVESLLGQIGYRLVAGTPYPEVPDVVPAGIGQFAELAGEWQLAGGGGLRAAPGERGLGVEPLDPTAFARLLSTAAPGAEDLALGAERAGRVEAASRAILAGDLTLLAALYREEAPTMERLEAAWSERLGGFVAAHGPAQGVAALGTARRGSRDYTVARFRFEHGAEDVAFVWQADPEGRLLGISRSGLAPRLVFLPVAGGGFAAWDPQTAASLPLTVEGTGAAAILRIGDGEAALEARRATPIRE